MNKENVMCMYTHTMEYYSAIKKNEIMLFAATWMDLEITILSEVSQTETNIIWYHICRILTNDTNELIYKKETDSQTGNQLTVTKEERSGRDELGVWD